MPTDRYLHISLSIVNELANICRVECTKTIFNFATFCLKKMRLITDTNTLSDG